MENADINEAGSVDFGDINPFVALLTRGPQAFAWGRRPVFSDE
jgi:hypothetical protein